MMLDIAIRVNRRDRSIGIAGPGGVTRGHIERAWAGASVPRYRRQGALSHLVGTLLVQAFVLAAMSAGLAVVLSRLLSRLFPSVISFPARTLVVLPLVALAVGLVGSLAGARRAITIDPASAFGGP